MSEPIRIACPSPADIPLLEAIIERTTPVHHLVLQFPLGPDEGPTFDKAPIVERLREQLPEDFEVFDSGTKTGHSTWITIKKVVSRQVVLSNTDLFVRAAREFREIANDLMGRLALKLGVDTTFFHDPYAWNGRFEQIGWLDSEWRYFFHGGGCLFVSVKTGQDVDVQLGLGGEFGVLDPWFFAQFIKTTPWLVSNFSFIEADFSSFQRALEVLGENGYLIRVTDPAYGDSGWVAF